MADILSGARKYRIGLTLAHHDLHQCAAQLRSSPVRFMSHSIHPWSFLRSATTMPRKLGRRLFTIFEARDLRNLEAGQATAGLNRSDYDFNLPNSRCPKKPDATQAAVAPGGSNHGFEKKLPGGERTLRRRRQAKTGIGDAEARAAQAQAGPAAGFRRMRKRNLFRTLQKSENIG